MKKGGQSSVPFLGSFRQPRSKAIVLGLEANLHACFQCLISVSLKSNLTDSENILKQPYFPASPFIAAADLPGGEHSYFLPGLCWSFAASGKSCSKERQ